MSHWTPCLTHTAIVERIGEKEHQEGVGGWGGGGIKGWGVGKHQLRGEISVKLNGVQFESLSQIFCCSRNQINDVINILTEIFSVVRIVVIQRKEYMGKGL